MDQWEIKYVITECLEEKIIWTFHIKTKQTDGIKLCHRKTFHYTIHFDYRKKSEDIDKKNRKYWKN